MATITEPEFKLLIATGTIRSVQVKRRSTEDAQFDNYGTGWIVWIVFGKTKSPTHKLIRTRRDPIRVFKNLDLLADWLHDLGINHFTVDYP